MSKKNEEVDSVIKKANKVLILSFQFMCAFFLNNLVFSGNIFFKL